MLKNIIKKNNFKKLGFLALEYVLILAIVGVGGAGIYVSNMDTAKEAQDKTAIIMGDKDAQLITPMGSQKDEDSIEDIVLTRTGFTNNTMLNNVGDTGTINVSIKPTTAKKPTLVWTLTGNNGVVEFDTRNTYEVNVKALRRGRTSYEVYPNGRPDLKKTVTIQVGTPYEVIVTPGESNIDMGESITMYLQGETSMDMSIIQNIQWEVTSGNDVGSLNVASDKLSATFIANGTQNGGNVNIRVTGKDMVYDASINLPAHITVNEVYQATFNSVYGSSTFANIKGAVGSTITIPSSYIPTATGRTFTGWRAPNGSLYQPGDSFTLTEEDWSFKAEYSLNNYTVTWHRNYLDKIEGTTSKAYTTALGELPVITRTGFTFDGWYTESTGGTKISSTTTMPAHDVTYYAHWVRNYYTISFNLNGGIGDFPDVEVGYNQSYTLPTTEPTRQYYEFSGWFDMDDWSQWFPGSSYKMPAEDVEMMADWMPIDYTITWHKEGGTFTETMPSTYTTEDSVTFPVGVTRMGYTFAGWYDNEEYEGSPITSIQKGDGGDKDCWAKWTRNKYTLTYDAAGGEVNGDDMYIVTVDYASSLAPLPVPERKGYKFLGWYDDTDLKIDDTRIMPARDYELIAKWEAYKYEIELDANGGSVSPDYVDVTYDKVIGTIPTPTRTNYTFVGWYTAKTGGTYYDKNTVYREAGGITLYARWSARYASVTLRNDITGATTTKEIMMGDTVDVGKLSAAGYKFKSYKSLDTSIITVSGTKLTAKSDGNVTIASNWTLIHPGYQEYTIDTWSCSAVTTTFNESASPRTVNYYTGPSTGGESTIDACPYNGANVKPTAGYTNHGTDRTVTRKNGKYVCSKVCDSADNADGTSRCSEAKITWVGVSASKGNMKLTTSTTSGRELVQMQIGEMAGGAKMTTVYIDTDGENISWSSSIASPSYVYNKSATKVMYDYENVEYDRQTGVSGYNQCEKYNCTFKYYFQLTTAQPDYDFKGGSFVCTERYLYSEQ